MRILITSAYTVHSETGSAAIAKLLAHELSRNHKVMYLCLGSNMEKVKVTNTLTYLKMPSSNINDIWVPVMSPKTINRIYEELDHFKPDVIHAQNIIFGGLLSLIWATERNVPYVLTFHSIPTEGAGYVFPKIKKGAVISKIDFRLTENYLKNFLKHVDFIIALNSAIVESLKKLKFKTNYGVINNGIQLAKLRSLKISPPGEVINFVFPGSYLERKNQEFLVNVFRHLPQNYLLNLYGNKKSGFLYAKKLENLIKKYKVKNVKVNDYKTETDMLKVYESTHYLVSASIKEVQSLVVIESLASGKPVIALVNETTKDLINKGNGLLLPQKSSSKYFAEKLKTYVLETNKSYLKVSTSARQSVSNFDIESVSKRLTDVYKKVIKSKKQRPKNKKKNELDLIQELIPEPLKGTFKELVEKTRNRKKNNTLKFFLAISSIVGGLGMIVAYIFKFTKLPSKIYSWIKKNV